jgi:hypothetical protein
MDLPGQPCAAFCGTVPAQNRPSAQIGSTPSWPRRRREGKPAHRRNVLARSPAAHRLPSTSTMGPWAPRAPQLAAALLLFLSAALAAPPLSGASANLRPPARSSLTPLSRTLSLPGGGGVVPQCTTTAQVAQQTRVKEVGSCLVTNLNNTSLCPTACLDNFGNRATGGQLLFCGKLHRPVQILAGERSVSNCE